MREMIRHLVLVLSLSSAASAEATSITGVGRAIDGDSLMVGDVEVRLHGIDAPELRQTCTRGGQPWACGAAAADRLAKLASGKSVSCVRVGQDRFGRALGQCRAGFDDLNLLMVASGHALAYRRYSTTYVSAEESARLAKRGIWSGTFELPSEVRNAGDDYVVEQPSRDRAPSGAQPVVFRSTKQQPAGNCPIKGNHSRKGERIYHLPGMPYYAQTVAEEIFCTEAQARAAGYRRSRADRHR